MNKEQSRITANKTAPPPPVRSRIPWAVLIFALVSAFSPVARANPIPKDEFAFVNVVDSTQGFLFFGFAPAINSAGAVAFEAAGSAFLTGSVWKWQDGTLTLIATSEGDLFRNFGDNVPINASGTVGFSASVPGTHDTIIATGDGGPLTIIASANEDGLVGGGFLGISALNNRGTAVFLAARRNTFARAIFAGNGGPLQTVVDTITDGFSGLGNSDIDASGKIAFTGFRSDNTEGIFVRAHDISGVIDTNDPENLGFIDPVMNDSGTVGIGAFLSNGNSQVLTAKHGKLTPRTDPDQQPFLSVDNVCVNNSGDVAFFGDTLIGGGIFAELTGAAHPVAVLEIGDALFGSTVVSLSNGRFSFNERKEIAFHYQLADGRSGIAIASPHPRD